MDSLRPHRNAPPLASRWLAWLAFLVTTSASATPFSGNIGTPTANGSDQSPLPRLYPAGQWLRIDDQILGSSLRIEILVNGRPTSVILDSGAQSTTISFPVARALGIRVDDEVTQSTRVIDAHGKIIKGVRTKAKSIQIGRAVFIGVDVLVVGEMPGLFVVGYDLMQRFDVFIAADHGLLGVFPPGEAPAMPNEAVFRVGGTSRRQMFVNGRVRNTKGNFEEIPFLVDTGASQSAIPARMGIEKGLKASTMFESRHGSVSGVQEIRGRFVLNPLWLEGVGADAEVGRVLAVGDGTSRPFGLLGLDVISRHHTVVSAFDGEVRMAQQQLPDGYRTKGPLGVSCVDKNGAPKPCLKIQLRKLTEKTSTWVPKGAMRDLCLSVDVDKAYAGKTLEMAISAYDEDNHDLFVGGALHVYASIPPQGARTCMSLWEPLSRLGLNATSQLSVRFVRGEGFDWPCDPTLVRCMRFTGPMAKDMASDTRAKKKSKRKAKTDVDAAPKKK